MSVAVMSPAFPTLISSYASIPPHITETDHVQRSLVQLRSKSEGLEQYIFLNGLKERDAGLFYQILVSNMMEIIPILYTPTASHLSMNLSKSYSWFLIEHQVGDACSSYSHIWRHPEGLYVSIKHKGQIRHILRQYPATNPRISVVTDGSRILGLGDLGANGLPISIGKLDLYIAGAGIRPASTIPICLDVGTNTKKFIEDPLYIGVRQKRPMDSEMEEFMEEFMSAMSEVFPELVVQFEDFSTDNAFKYLDLFRSRYRVFNDDIQGTGAVVLSGFINAARISSAASGLPLTEHRILFFGAGSSGIGVAKQLVSFFTELGMSADEAKKHIYTVDSKGLVTADRKGLQEHKTFFARTDYQGPALTKLADIVRYVKPTALLGLSTIGGAFTEEVVKLMASMNKRPIIFPLSNPVSKCELTFQDAINWTEGRVVFASGSPYKPVIYEGTAYEAGQGNNMYMFPGIGLGAILSKAKHITDAMVERAAIALSTSLNEDENCRELVYPRLDRIRDISAQVALAVARQAHKDGVDNNLVLRNLNDSDALRHIKGKMWEPCYESRLKLGFGRL
ncbi:malate dehydrogenase [Lentinula aciculospora]|uniref:Malic enzyme n=1 Tax=Lentinula aciculospora TaxID=153920 RepID=A0A9W9AGL2_9AGAR|nr:malate dehydrogenase [Lentinula aciculospora]